MFDHATRMFVFKRAGSPASAALPGDVFGRMDRVEAESEGELYRALGRVVRDL